MASYPITKLKERVNKYILENFMQLITGGILNGILHDIIDSIINYFETQFAGEKYEGSYAPNQLDMNYSITIELPFSVSTPDVTIYNSEGVREVEMNLTVQRVDPTHVKITHTVLPSGPCLFKIKK